MRLIDADVLMEQMKRRRDFVGRASDPVCLVEDAPTIDAVPVKHGHWVKVGGYFTPGGDPLWKCSECGKGLHLYGVEHGSYGSDVADSQWVACPNCGAKMDEVSK